MGGGGGGGWGLITRLKKVFQSKVRSSAYQNTF